MQFFRAYLPFSVTTTLFVVLACHTITIAESHSLKSRFFRGRNFTRTANIGGNNGTVVQKISQKASLFPGLILIGSTGNKSFYTDPDKLGLTWSESLDFCHELGKQPASLETLAEHKVARNYLGKLPHRFFWLAGTDYFHEGTWKWLKTGETFKFQRWTQGYPTKNRKNNCLYLSYGNDGWIDASCSSNKLIIRPLCQSEKI